MIWFWAILSFLLLILCGVLSWQLYKFAKIIMVFEDNIADAIGALDDAENSIEGLVNLQMFFDSKDIQRVVFAAKENIKMAQLTLHGIAVRFVQMSKNKYILIQEEENVNDLPMLNNNHHYAQQPQPFNGQLNEGTIAHVGRPSSNNNTGFNK